MSIEKPKAPPLTDMGPFLWEKILAGIGIAFCVGMMIAMMLGWLP